MKRHIPNFLTLLNLLCGSIAVIYVVNNNFVVASLFVFLGIFFDFFDGFAARKLNVQSELGIQLDSLADLVTSGLVPGLVMFKLLSISTNTSEIINEWSSYTEWTGFKLPILPLLGLLITLASAYRLAKFNIDEDQQDYFKGLPTPANTLLIISLPLIIEFHNSSLIDSILLNKWFLIGITFLSCYLLNSSVKLMALKFKNWSLKNNTFRYVLIMVSFLLLMVFKFIAIPVIILVYILLSLLNQSFIVK
ncbi:CDP-alcohol phosphatidyltransferase family protein [Yeosuana sp. MJ-SS3]|uniref:CDP-alcohol phosphatidyltransferase family protein n=1 Tax=Gilvirhabdus luticola TaxID=3079858 RepID=A0ABU3U4W0_9FLAO|nr:CDP-alcohol phosphatidyltransferase family protein [Yeosuana sp. MJ-SS3]MDU8885451.1 CDP-alcohol phosphatidyltransferase family protein [Yeosuana sp. MJ-SS3]